jgi:hypothetical protein
MLNGRQHDGPAYWLQLLVAMGIAMLGLVMSSDAVVIGAMLISPLMDPMVELGMGLAIGKVAAAHRTEASEGPRPRLSPDFDGPGGIVGEYFRMRGPKASVGPLLSWDLRISEGPPALVDVTHFGPALGATAAELLGRDLTREVGALVVVIDHAASSETPDQGASWLPELLRDARVAAQEPRTPCTDAVLDGAFGVTQACVRGRSVSA